MSVTIISGIPIFAGPLNIVVDITAPNIPGGGSITIGDVFGLEAALQGKLDDTIGTIAPLTIDVTITGAELNFLAGVSSLIQSQIDSKVAVAGDLMIGNLAFGGSVQLEADAGSFGLPSIVCVGDLDTGYFWPAPDTLGISVGGLDAFRILPNGLLESQITTYETLVTAGSDDSIPNKKYVTDAIGVAVSGSFLPLAGGIMLGDIDLNGVARLRLDADGNSFFEALADDLVNLWVGGSVEFFWNATCFDMVGKKISNVLDPTAAQEAATMNYVDTEILALNLGGTTGPYLPLSGVDPMAGALNMGNNLIQSVSDPSEGQDAATKSYVDTEILDLNLGGTIGPYLPLSGVDPMTGPLDMGTFRATNLADPVAPQDAVTQAFADITYVPIDGSVPATGNLDAGGNNIINVADPVNPQDASTKAWTETNFLDLAGTSTMTGDLNMGTHIIRGVTDPVEGPDAATKNYVDTTFLDLLGTSPMQAALSMDGFAITDVLNPSGAQDAATKDYVDTEISDLSSSGTFVASAGDTMTGDLITDTGVQHSADPGTDGAPSYSFTGDLDSGSWWDGTNLRWTIGGVTALTVSPSEGANEVDVHGRQVVGVDDPTLDSHAVTKGFLDSQAMVKLLGSVTGVDLLSTGTTTIYTVPSGKMHIITQILVRTTAYTPGEVPTNPEASVGLTGSFNQIIDDNTVLDWGGTAGAGDQVVYLQPKDGADTPNALDLVRFQVDTAGGGDFSALTATVYVLGIEL